MVALACVFCHLLLLILFFVVTNPATSTAQIKSLLVHKCQSLLELRYSIRDVTVFHCLIVIDTKENFAPAPNGNPDSPMLGLSSS